MPRVRNIGSSKHGRPMPRRRRFVWQAEWEYAAAGGDENLTTIEAGDEDRRVVKGGSYQASSNDARPFNRDDSLYEARYGTNPGNTRTARVRCARAP
jgi:hypothetical protein